jgi:hypothetical protein
MRERGVLAPRSLAFLINETGWIFDATLTLHSVILEPSFTGPGPSKALRRRGKRHALTR